MTSDISRMKPFRVIAIDGGAASGKSSTSSLLAERCNLLHVDTGSHYRAVTFACLEKGIHPEDTRSLNDFLQTLSFSTRISGHEAWVCIGDGPPLTVDQLRSREVNTSVSPFSALPPVREAVKAYQREQVNVARSNGFSGIVMDGRDIGTVILPDADVKFFLKADAATREKRRRLEGASDAIGDRDRRDASRSTAPMKAADDAIIIDNSNISLEQVVDRIISMIQQ